MSSATARQRGGCDSLVKHLTRTKGGIGVRRGDTMHRDNESIYRETMKKEARHPAYAKDLEAKRAEGLAYEASIISMFNHLSWR